MAEFLFEIGTEEIPPYIVPLMLNELKEKCEKRLKEKRIDFESLEVLGTSRRLVIIVRNISERQKDHTETIFGPSINVALNPDGTFTKAALAFAKKNNVDVEVLKIVEGPKGKVVSLTKEIKGKRSEDILKEEIPQIIDSLYLPKAMKWGEGNHIFVRPVRWVLALFDGNIVDMKVKGITASNRTRGHKIFGKKELAIKSIDEYLNLLKKEYVIVDQNERKEKIIKELNNIASKYEGDWDDKSEEIYNLVETILYLCEYPQPVIGEIELDFLSLPQPVLSTCLREHQKFFGLFRRNEKDQIYPLPYFIGFCDGPLGENPNVINGYKSVTTARLSDAKFFFEHDKEVKLERRLKELKEIVFHPKIGTYYEKAIRMERYARELAPYFNADENLAKRAALLSKCDLATLLVQEKEFTSLQGIAGGLYAEAQGEDIRVARAIYEHYSPPILKDEPTNIYSIIVALADRLDTLIEFFKIGEIPSGSRDPYGLRRAGKIIVDLLSNKDYYKENFPPEINLEEILQRWYGNGYEKVIDFLKERFKTQLEMEKDENGRERFNYDEINAILATPFKNLFELKEKLLALNIVRAKYKEDFDALSIAFKRARNILKNMPSFRLDPSKFLPEETKEGSAERALHKAYIQIKDTVEKQIKERNYLDALTSLSTLRPFIDKFFDDVLVMVDPEGKDPQKTALQQNRLALLERISKLFYEIADFSEIVPKEE